MGEEAKAEEEGQSDPVSFSKDGASDTPVDSASLNYQVKKVDMSARLTRDGKMSVTVERVFDFHEAYNGVYWDLAGTRAGGVRVTAVGESSSSGDIPFHEVSSAENGEMGVYALEDAGGDNEVRVKIYRPSNDEQVTFYVSYVVDEAVTAYADVAELCWRFVPEGWSVPNDDVRCVVTLPISNGDSARLNDNVYVWGHCPLDGSYLLSGAAVTYEVPSVPAGEFAEARIAFPVEWLDSNAVINSAEEALPRILEEES